MKQYPFIFSNQLQYRLRRHVLFWFCWWLFCSILYSYLPSDANLPNYKRLLISATEALIFLPIHMFVSYGLVYFVVPQLLTKGYYLYSFIAVLVLFLITGILNAFIAPHVGDIRNTILRPIFEHPYPRRYIRFSFHYSMMAGLRGGITVGGLAAAIKLMKYWHVKEQRNLQLIKENTEAQLQLLKAQIHPHFLFNTLNNIYSFTQDTAPKAAKLVTELSDLLRYMLYEGNQPLVPLHKEFKMLEDYISIEKVRYQKIDMQISLPDATNDLYIAPLLLLPFVENCFKHGTSSMLENPWISMTVIIKDCELNLKLVNGKTNQQTSGSKGIGIDNVRKRLDLLYPQKHTLKITNEEDVFIVDLKLELIKKQTVAKAYQKLTLPAHV